MRQYFRKICNKCTYIYDVTLECAAIPCPKCKSMDVRFTSPLPADILRKVKHALGEENRTKRDRRNL
jgi:hypothetical protein